MKYVWLEVGDWSKITLQGSTAKVGIPIILFWIYLLLALQKCEMHFSGAITSFHLA